MLITTRNGQWIFSRLETSFLTFVAISNLYLIHIAHLSLHINVLMLIKNTYCIFSWNHRNNLSKGNWIWIQWKKKGIHDWVSSMNNAYGMKPCLVTFEPTRRVLILKASLTWNCNLLSMSKDSFLNVFYFWRGLYLLELIHELR